MSEDRTVVVDRGGGGGSTAIVAIVVIVLLAIAAWWFFMGPGVGSQGSDVNVDVNLPTLEVPTST